MNNASVFSQKPKLIYYIHFRLRQVLKEKHSLTFSHFQTTFQPAGIFVFPPPAILGNRKAKAHFLSCEQRPFDLPR